MKNFLILIFPILLILSGCKKTYFDENANDPEYIFECFWKDVDRNFSFFSYLNLNWDSVHTVYKQKINKNTSLQALSVVLGNMIKLLKDGHSNLFTSYGIKSYDDWYTNYSVNQISDIAIRSYLEYYKIYYSNIYYGKINSTNIGYIYIKNFEGDTSKYTIIDNILNDFSSTEGIIIDVRSNGGGNSINGTTISKRFADSTRYIFKIRYRNGPNHNDFNPWRNCYLNPGGKVHYSKPVIILTNRRCFSATGWFLLEMRSLPQVKIVGDTTGGGSAQPIVRELPNSWILRVSNSQRLNPDGKDDQYTGLYPDIPVWISAQDAAKGIDTILERAIEELTKK